MFRRFLSENVGLKVVSLLLAVALELYLIGPDNITDRTMAIRIEVEGLPSNVVITSPVGGAKGLFAEVRVSGPRNLVQSINPAQYRFRVNLPQPVPETFRGSLSAPELRLDSRLQVVGIHPPAIELKMEPLERRELLVVVDKIGEVPRGYTLKSIRIAPETIFARGPKSELQGLSLIRTEPLDMSQFTVGKKLTVALESRGEFTTLTADDVELDIDVQPIIEEKVFNKVRVGVDAPAGLAASAEPSNAKLVIEGPQLALANLKANEITLLADATELPAGSHEVTLKAKTPDGILVKRIEPEKVKVQIVAGAH